MKYKPLTETEISLIQRFTFERDGFKVLIKEFSMDSILDTEFNLNAEEWEDIRRDYSMANDLLMVTINEIAQDQNAFKSFNVDFNKKTLSWEA